MKISLCESCELVRILVTPKGSRFLRCRHSAVDERYSKYPPQPVIQCPAHRSEKTEKSPDDNAAGN